MAKAELKTRPTEANVEEFLNTIEDEHKRADSFKLLEMFSRLSGEDPKMWGPAIVGFGSKKLRYASGRELDWPITAFSPRKGDLTLYVNDSTGGADHLMAKLGKYKTGKGCLYIKKLTDVDAHVLEQVISHSIKRSREAQTSGG